MSTIEELTDALREAAQGQLAAVTALRRRIHSRPELGLDLPVTQAVVLEELEGLGLEVRTGDALTSVVADLDTGRPGRTILLRADMDALPMDEHTGLDFASQIEGRMHACGHDAHVAMLVGAARVLAEQRDELSGRVRFMFQPGEEGSGGADRMISEGVLDGVDAAFAIHVAPNVGQGHVAWRGGPLLAAADEFNVRLVGRGGHASTPHWALDPIPVAAEIVLALQTMVTRNVNVFNPAVLTVARITAGTTHNIIPETVELEGTMRTIDEKVRRELWDRLRTVVSGVAGAHGCSAEVEVTEGYPVTVNDRDFAEFAAEVARDVVGQAGVIRLPSPEMGAEDFSYVLAKVPGAMVFLGVCPPEQGDPARAPSCHSNRLVIHEPAMATGVALHVAVASRFLQGGSS